MVGGDQYEGSMVEVCTVVMFQFCFKVVGFKKLKGLQRIRVNI